MVDSSSSASSRSGSDHESESQDPTTHVIPTPYKWGVLRRRTQRTHVSQAVWNENTCRVLKIRRGKVTGGPNCDNIPDIVAEMLGEAGFLHVARMRHIQIDPALISALVERWRPETHTFHMTQGEMTITLEDVAGILGLASDGNVVSGSTSDDWATVIEEVFGHLPQAEGELKGGYLRLSYFDRHYAHWGEVAANSLEIVRFTKAHIARMIGAWLLCDRSGGSTVACRYVPLLEGDFKDIGSYSWGSAVLAHLFRQMCECTDPQRSDIGGCHVLLQIWAWLRFPPIAPAIPQPTQLEWHYGHRFNTLGRFQAHELLWYRLTLDSLSRDEVVWQPYADYHFLGASDQQRLLWMASTPIICFHTVEYSHPDRCMRQFERDQSIPRRPKKLKGVHDLSLRGKPHDNWVRKLRPFIRRWEARDQHIDLPPLLNGLLSPNHEYMVWFRENGKRYVSKNAAKTGRGIDGLEMLYFATGTEQWPGYTVNWVHEEIGRIISIFKKTCRLEEAGPPAPPSQFQHDPQVHVDVPRGRQEGHGLERRRKVMHHVPEPIGAPRPRTDGWFRPPLIGSTYGSQPMYYGTTQQGDMGYEGFSSHSHIPPSTDSQTQPVFYATALSMASGDVGVIASGSSSDIPTAD